jgi:L-methionine (R)-S-oxide reductase
MNGKNLPEPDWADEYPTDMVSQAEKDLVMQQLESSPFFGRALRHLAMRLLSQLEGYNWCGIYRLEDQELVLDEFVGTPTEHTHIPVGRGVCGTAVAENKNQIVGDVTQLDNYLACSTATKSEIVVLIRKDGQILGQIDIDGHDANGFDTSDEELLSAVADGLALCWDEDAEACAIAKEMEG